MSGKFPDFNLDSAIVEKAIVEKVLEKGTTEDDFWMQTQLRESAVTLGFITRNDLSRIMRWKLKTGKWRPNLQKFVDEASDEFVREVSTRAFTALRSDDLKGALTELCKVKGVGPATASAILSAFDPCKCVFMSDESLLTVLGTKQYTLAEALKLTKLCSAEAKRRGGTWTANGVQRAVWATTNNLGSVKRSGGATKRRRE